MAAGEQGSLPTLLRAGGHGEVSVPTKGAHTESAPPQELMITEEQKLAYADIKTSQVYACLNCGTTLAERATTLRRGHFSEVGASVGKDDMGWPSVLPYMLHYDGDPLTGGKATTMPNIEMFQRDNIFFCGLLGGVCRNMWDARICLSAPCTLALGRCAAERADDELLQTSTLDDSFFNEVFNMHFGGTMLRGPTLNEDTLGLETAVVCDLQELQGLELRQGRFFQPCKIIFQQDEDLGLVVEAVVVMSAENEQPLVFRKGTSSPNEWLWAKRLAVAGAVQRHQYDEHLVNGHMVMETFVALAYKHLSVDHYVFKLLEPVGGDVGFVNRTWGTDLLLSNEGSPYEPCLHLMSPQSLMSTTGVRDQVNRARQRFQPQSWFWFDQDGYMKGACGVKKSTSFPLRDTAQQLFDVMLAWTSCVVDTYWQDQDEALKAWWKALWWRQMKPAKRELSQDTLSHLLATCILQATYVHDLAHESWLPDNHSQLLWKLSSRGTSASSTDPKDYLPSAAEQSSYRLGLMALNGSSLESPLVSYRKVFQDKRLQHSLKTFEDNLARIVQATPYLKSIGSMSH